MSVVVNIWWKGTEEALPRHEAVVTCDLAFALKLKGLLEHLDDLYAVSFSECANYRPLQTSRPAHVDQDVLVKVNEWLKAKGFPPVAL